MIIMIDFYLHYNNFFDSKIPGYNNYIVVFIITHN